jgi:hypothetical protein
MVMKIPRSLAQNPITKPRLGVIAVLRMNDPRPISLDLYFHKIVCLEEKGSLQVTE